MTSILANIYNKEQARRSLSNHPLAARIEDEGQTLLILFPAGSESVVGLRCFNTYAGMSVALRRLEQLWRESLFMEFE